MPVLVSRQPVVDREMRVTGYRVSYAALDGGAVVPPGEESAMRLFGDVLTVVGLEELVGTSLAHLPVSRELLVTLGIPPVGPDRVMLRLDHGIAVDTRLRPIVEQLARLGYALSVYDLPGVEFDTRLLDLFGTVEVELDCCDHHEIADVIPRVLACRATPMAVGLIEHHDYQLAQELGFELFAGPFIASPRTTEARLVPVGEIETLAALAVMQREAAQIEEIEQIINQDVGLSLKLLRYINSAYFGIRHDITSVRQAVMMLGSRGVSRWALLVALTSGPNTPRELAFLALARARMCELLGRERGARDTDELFTIGMLSVAGALLDTPLEDILAQLPLAAEVIDALVGHAGPAGEVLETVLTYEDGRFAADSVQHDSRAAAEAYRNALAWAQEIITNAT